MLSSQWQALAGPAPVPSSLSCDSIMLSLTAVGTQWKLLPLCALAARPSWHPMLGPPKCYCCCPPRLRPSSHLAAAARADAALHLAQPRLALLAPRLGCPLQLVCRDAQQPAAAPPPVLVLVLQCRVGGWVCGGGGGLRGGARAATALSSNGQARTGLLPAPPCRAAVLLQRGFQTALESDPCMLHQP